MYIGYCLLFDRTELVVVVVVVVVVPGCLRMNTRRWRLCFANSNGYAYLIGSIFFN